MKHLGGERERAEWYEWVGMSVFVWEMRNEKGLVVR